MRKVKRKKRGPRRPLTFKRLVMITAILAISAILLFLYLNRPNEIDKLNTDYISTMNRNIVKEKVKTSYPNTFKAADYTVYGETLALYGDEYGGVELDPFLGKAVQLQNVETGEQYSFTFSGKGDAAIQLGELSEGIYDIYIYDQYTKKRIYFDAPIHSDEIVTMRRNGEVKTVTLEAGKDLFKNFNITLDKDYAYLVVKDTIPQKEIIDVLIDPSGNVLNEITGEIYEGALSDTINEKETSYTLALQMKEALEKYGLKVELTRDENGALSYYGKEGRVGKGYEKKAKLFIDLSMCDEESINRPFLKVSPWTNASFANQIVYFMEKDGVELDYPYSSSDLLNSGVIFDSLLTNDQYELTNYSIDPALRESGGKATYAGQLNELGNQRYANAYGMNAVVLVYANIQNQDSINYFKQNKDLIVRSFVQGIASYYDLKEEQDETATQ